MSRVYFVKSARSNAVKIGVAEDPRQRVVGMQTGSAHQLVLLAEVPGDEQYERLLHTAFADLRIRGEWFRLEGRLAAFVSALPSMPIAFASSPAPRQRDPELDTLPITRQKIYRDFWNEHVELLENAVTVIGQTRFARHVGVAKSTICDALRERNRRNFHARWVQVAILLAPPSIANAILEHQLQFIRQHAVRGGEVIALGDSPSDEEIAAAKRVIAAAEKRR